MQGKIQKLLSRLKEVEELLGDPTAYSDKARYKEITREHAYLSEVKTAWDYLQKVSLQLTQMEELLLSEKDPELISVIKEEIVNLQTEITNTTKNLETLLVPPDPNDSRPILLEIRAGTGGDEAALFVANCVRMYQMYADQKGWKYEIISATPSDLGGYKECVMGISGTNVYRLMQYEAGTHRVQRVPATETQGRVHTSAVTVAVLLEPGEEEQVVIDEKDLKIDTYRSSGAGGQHVNVTDSAVRITHIPTGTVVACQEERSQHKNREKAMRVLSARIAEKIRQDQINQMSSLRQSQVGSGDRSERIRTYNFPQNRVTDHRIDLTLYKLDRVMQGDLDEITTALVAYFYQEKLAK